MVAIKGGLLFSVALAFASIQILMAGDADITSDFIVPPNVTSVDGNFFTHGIQQELEGIEQHLTTFEAIKITMMEFPALNGQSVAAAALFYPPRTVNPPHTHPRASELLFLLSGSLEVGFVDTTNKLFNQTLKAGELFVFPKGLVHFQYNKNAEKPAFAVSSFGSASPGTVSVPSAVFNTSISDDILAKSFKTDVGIIRKIRVGLARKA